MPDQTPPPDPRPVGARHRLARALADAAASRPDARAERSEAPAADPPEAGSGSDAWVDLIDTRDPWRPAEPAADPPAAALRADPEPETPQPGTLVRLGAAAFDPGRPGVRVLAAVAAVVVLAAAALAWWSRPRPEPVLPQLAVTASAAATAGEPAELVVAVSGKVREPGLVRLAPGARVADAIEAAGGLLPEADLDHLNLARKVTDGELITVGIPPPPGEPAGGGSAGRKINLNTATQAELETLPGVGPALAQRIIDHRSQDPFSAVSELRQVSGIGEVRFAELRDLVTV